MAIPHNYLPVGEGMLPNGTTSPFFVDTRELESIRTSGQPWLYEDARFIPEAIAEPDAIFAGLRRPNQADSLCYSVRPTRDPDEEDETEDKPPPRFGQVFLVFTCQGSIGYLVFGWEWREEDGDCPGHPLNWKADFTGRVWPQT